MKITFDPIWPLPWVILAIAGLLLLVLRTYPSRVRHLRARDRRVLIGLRLATVAVLAIAMLRPVLHIRKTEDEPRTLYILADSSRSMSVRDGVGLTGENTRRQELLKTLKDAEAALAKLGKDVEIRYFDYAETLKPVDALEDTTDGTETNIANALKSVLRLTDGKKMLGLIVMGDGAVRVYNTAAGENPRQQSITASRELGERGVKVHTVAYGGTGATGSAADLALVDLTVDANPYEGKVVTVNATIRAFGAKGQRLTARILVENRAGAAPGMDGTMEEARPIKSSKPRDNNIVPAGGEDVITRELTFVPTRPGKYKVAVEVSGLPNERNVANNVITRIIDVRAGGISVAYFDRIRPEQRWLRKVNASDKIQLDYYPYLRGRNLIEPKLFQDGENAYDVFIIGDVPASAFGAANLKLLRKRIDDGAGLMMIGGYNNFGPGGYGNTPLEAVLPVAMSSAAAKPIVDERTHYLKPLKMIPTELGLRHFVMRIAPDGKHRELWEKLVPLEGANRLRRKTIAGGEDLVKVLATTPDGSPLLLAVEWGGIRKPGQQSRSARVMAFGADTTYQWFLNGEPDAHQRFWRQVILYLAQKEEDDAPVWVKIDAAGKRNFTPKDTIPIRFGAQDQNHKPLVDVDYEIEVLGPPKGEAPGDRHTYTLQHGAGSGENFRELVPNPVPGEYWIRVTGRRKDVNKTVHGTGWERFLVETTDLELDNPAADRNLLQSLAEQSGGTFIAQPADFKDFLDRLTIPTDDLQVTEAISLWDTWPRFDEDGENYIPGLLLLFVALMSMEWFLRKRRGLV